MKLRMNVKTLAAWTLLVALVPTLTACFGAAVVGAGAGVLLASDRRASETYLTDEGIEMRATSRIGEQFGERVHINVTSYNRTVLLTGEVPDAATKDAVEKLVSKVQNIKAISNELQIGGVSSLGGRSNDTYITSKVKARFIDANQFIPSHVKVVTEASVVYLLGLTTKYEAEAAVEIASTTGGVLKVVRVMELIDDAIARKLDNRPADADKPMKAQKPAATAVSTPKTINP